MNSFTELTKAPAPGFKCYAAGKESGPRFIVAVRHILNGPASAKALAQIHKMLGAYADQVATFYKQHDGIVLYRDTKSQAAGIELLPVAKWEAATEDMRDWFDLDPENDPDHIVTGISIATVPHSGNYFVMPVDGPTAGKIFYANHDGWYESAFADDFNGFLERVSRDPVKLLADDVGCYTRFTDGQTDAQWIPEVYYADIPKEARD